MSILKEFPTVARRLIGRPISRIGVVVIRTVGGEAFVNTVLAIPTRFFHRQSVRGWCRALQSAGYPGQATRYAMTLYKQKPEPWSAYAAAVTLVESGRFQEALDLVSDASTKLQPRPKEIHHFEWMLDLESVATMELNAEVAKDLQGAVLGRDELADFFYRRAWKWHTLLDAAGVSRSVRQYCEAIGFEPEATIYACETLLRPYDLWKEIDNILQEVEHTMNEREAEEGRNALSRRRKGEVQLRRRLLSLRTFARLQEYDFVGAEQLFAGPDGDCAQMQFAWSFYHYLKGNPDNAVKAISRALRATKITKDNKAYISEMVHFTGTALEEAQRYGSSREYLKRAHQIGGVQFYLPDATWRYVSLLTAFNEWGRSAALLEAGLRQIWQSYHKLARVPIERRIRTQKLVPRRAVILGGNGVGDEILRLAFLRELAPKKSAQYGYICDQRVAGLFERAMPGTLTALHASRTSGAFAVPEDQFWRDREGMPPWADRMRLTKRILREEIPKYGEIMLSEDLMYSYFIQHGRYRGSVEPLFKALPERKSEARAWLDSLPGAIKVGISWRSGQPGVARDICYTKISQWGDILTLPNVSFVLLQYSNRREDIEREITEAKERFGVTIHVPNIDLKNDFEGMVALCKELDVVIAPGTTLRETAAAAGARTWTLSTTPYLPDQWRIDQADKETDLIFPSMIHFTALRYNSREGALAEIAKRLKEEVLTVSEAVAPPGPDQTSQIAQGARV